MPLGASRNGARGQTLPAITYEWSTPLRVFILYANPVAASFGATLHRQVVTTLRSRGHEIDDCDLYAERFNPIVKGSRLVSGRPDSNTDRPTGRLAPVGRSGVA